MFVYLKLLDYKICALDQVPFLLAMKEDKLALLTAVDSRDMEIGMCSSVLLEAKQFEAH